MSEFTAAVKGDRPRLTHKALRRMQEMRQQGKSWWEIATTLGYASAGNAWRAAKQHGLTRPAKRIDLPAVLARWRRGDLSLRELAVEVGHSPSGIITAMRRAGERVGRVAAHRRQSEVMSLRHRLAAAARGWVGATGHSQCDVLDALERRGQLTPKELMAELGVTSTGSYLRRVLTVLRKSGLVGGGKGCCELRATRARRED